MTTTTAEVRALALLALGDPGGATWPTDTVDDWVEEAIRDYSQHFKRTLSQTIDCVDDQHNYDLNYDVRGIISVEYPQGEDPPEYLDRKSRLDPDFWTDDGYYDWEPAYQEVDHTGSAPPVLWISAEPVDTEDILVTYHAHFHYEASNEVLVPEEHIPILILFVQWKAMHERMATATQAPDYSQVLITQLRAAVDSARATYEKALRTAVQASSRSLPTPHWEMDGGDRIY